MEIQFPDVIDLNVGGVRMTTFLGTLTKEQDSMLAAMFSGRHVVSKDKDGCYFIDCDGSIFRYILNYLRSGNLPPAEDALKVYDLASYLQIQSLVTSLKVYQAVQDRMLIRKMKNEIKNEEYEAMKKEIIDTIYQTSDSKPIERCSIVVHLLKQSFRQPHYHDIRYIRCIRSITIHPINISTAQMTNVVVKSDMISMISRNYIHCLAYDLKQLGFGKYSCISKHGDCWMIILSHDAYEIKGFEYLS